MRRSQSNLFACRAAGVLSDCGRPRAVRPGRNVRVAVGAIAIVLCGIVAAPDAGAVAPPAPPGCGTAIVTSDENTTPVAIPTGPGVVTSTIDVAGAGAHLTDVDLFTQITHTFSADLDITLQSPAGTVSTITTDNGAGNDNTFAGTTFDDQADPDGQVPYVTNPGLVTDNPYVNNTAATPLVPEEALAAFAGENPNGTWTLTISDDLAGDGGTLQSWRLDIQSLPAAPVSTTAQHENTTPTAIPTGPAVVSSTIDVAGAGAYLTDVDLFTQITHTFSADLDITLQSPAGTVSTITTDNGAGNDNTFAGTLFDDQADPGGQVPYVTNPGLVTDNPYVNNTAATPLVPEEALAAFAGENPNGTWTLTISDDLAGDGGTLQNWRLDATTGSCPQPPVANDDAYAIAEDTPLGVAAPGVLGNDGDADGDALTAVLVSGPAHGTLTLNGDGSFAYTPATSYNGSDSFTYKANDGSLDSNTATVTITVRAVNDAPVCTDVSASTEEDTRVELSPACSDIDSASLGYAIAGQPAHGTAGVVAGRLRYTPDADYNGVDSFTYTADDGSLRSTPATVTITVRAVNDAPVCTDVSASTEEDTRVELSPACSDIDSASLLYAIAGQPAHGTAGVVAGRLRYTPDADYNGVDSFTYVAGDGSVESRPATAAITINARPAAPPPAAVMRVRTPPLSVFSRAGSRVRCRIASGAISACTARLLHRGRVLARGRATATGPAARGVTVKLRLTRQGRALLARRVGGVPAAVRAQGATSAGPRSARARTRALLAVERFTTPPGSWLANEAALSARGRRFLRGLRGRLIAVAAVRCDGHAARVRAHSRNATRISLARAAVTCAALESLAVNAPTTVVGHGDSRPIASNHTASGRARNRRVEVTITHRRTRL
jgi:VCBS repeat-containing protein